LEAVSQGFIPISLQFLNSLICYPFIHPNISTYIYEMIKCEDDSYVYIFYFDEFFLTGVLVYILY